jgi:DNA-binding winged helix-turn-helix (wHTH) protein/Tol biopolymer transport system component
MRPPPIAFGPFAFDTTSRLLKRSGQEVPLPPRVIGVLELLLERAGDVVPRQALIDTVWKDAFVTDTSLAEAVSVLRQVLGDDPQSPTYIQTLHRRGYRFVAPISKEQEDAIAAPEPKRVVVSPSIGRELVPWSVAVICAIVAGVAVWQYTRRAPASAPVAARFAIQLPQGVGFDEVGPSLAFSPDGTVLAWSACDAAGCRIYTRGLDQIDAVPLEGTEDAHAPFFSPDGRWLAFFANGRLSKIALAGGSPIAIADAPTPLGGVWIDREIVFAGSPTGGLMRVSSDGGEPRTFTTPHESAGDVRHAWPSLVPGTRVVLFVIDTTPATDSPGPPGILAAATFNPRSSDRSTPRPAPWQTVLDNVSVARAADRETIVFARDSELHAVAFDPARMALSGTPAAIRGQLATARGRAQFALSSSGSLVHAVATDAGTRTVVFLQPASKLTEPPRQLLALREASIAPDGSRISGVNLTGTGAGIWISDSQRANATRLVHKGVNASPVWSADGRSVFYASREQGAFDIWRRDVEGTEPPVRLLSTDRHAFPLAASPDGRHLAYLQTADATRADIWLLPLQGGSPRVLVQTPFDEGAASFSPDSEYLAFESAETGRWEVYVQRVRDGRRVLVSTGGGQNPSWNADGLYYQCNRTVMRKSIAADGGGIAVDDGVERRAAFAARLDHRTTLQDVAPDGQLLLSRPDPDSSSAIVSLEWLRQIRTLLGPPASALPR